MSIIAPTSPSFSNPTTTPDGDTNQGHNPGPIPGSPPDAKWVHDAQDLKADEATHDVNQRPRSSEEADADARKVQQSQTLPASVVAPSRAPAPLAEPVVAVPVTTPQRGNRNV